MSNAPGAGRTSIKPSGRRDRQNARGNATREQILLTAERLFAERGIGAVPLRDIGLAAGQKNNVAVQYHFGDRETLIQEVARFRAGFTDEMCRDLARRTELPTVLEYVHAFVLPLAANIGEGNYYLPFLARYLVERASYEGLAPTVTEEVRETLTAVARQILPHVPEPVLDERWQLLLTSAVQALARHQSELRDGRLTLPIELLVEDLVQFLAAGLAAPLNSPVGIKSSGRTP